MNKIFWFLAPLCLPLVSRADLRDDFNELFQKGKYDEAERLLAEKGPSFDNPSEAARILESLREFRTTDRDTEAAFIIHNPTGNTLNYQTRFGDGEWADSEIKPFKSWRHRSPAAKSGEALRGRPQLRQVVASGEPEPKTYNLEASIVKKGEWAGVNKYYFAPRSADVTYVVTGIDSDDTLNVRSGPGTDNDIVARLSNGSGGIKITGDKTMNGNDDWVPISFPDGTGWTRPKYLASSGGGSGTLGLFTFHEMSDSVGAVKIENSTENLITFKWRWGEGDWNKKELGANSGWVFWWDYYPGVSVSPDFEIEFDYVAGDDGYTPKNMILKRFKCARSNTDGGAKRYYFTYDNPSLLSLYER